MKNPKNILITGASSGIGKSLAIAYSSEGVNLFICSRNAKKLDETKKICESLKANVYAKELDVKNEKDAENWIEEIEKNHQIDLVIANAGISAGTAGGTESLHQIKEIFSTNIDGVINITHPTIEKMKLRKKGQIALVSSLASFRGLPSSPTYSASKAAVRLYGEALRGNLSQFGIEVSVICPGYIITPMTAVNNFYMPLLMSSEKCAKIIKKNLEKNKAQIAFPFLLYFVVMLASLLPSIISDPIFSALPKKKSI